MSNVPTSSNNENEEKTTAYNANEGGEGVIKRTFHLGGSKYVIFLGIQGLTENIYLKEWEDGEVKNKGIKLTIPILVVILHNVEFIVSSIQKISDGKREVDSSYRLGSGIYVSCATPYRNMFIRFWKTANGKKYPTPEGISFKFNEWDQFIKVAQSQSWGLTSRSTARVILGQVLSIATCGTRTHRGDSLWLDAKLANH